MSPTLDEVRLSAYQVEVVKLRQQVEDLQFTVRDLSRMLLPPTRFPVGWKLWIGHDRVLSLLVDAAPRPVSREAIRIALAGTIDAEISDNYVRVQVHILRKLLVKQRLPPAVMPKRHAGYYITTEHAALIEAKAARACGSKP